MKSNVCKIENGTKDLAAILKECEKVAVYNELTHKQALQLRLLCEEIDGMLPNIIDDFGGDLWIEFENGVCRVNVSLRFEEFSVEKKEELVKLSRNKKNAAAVGIVGRIRSALEDVFLGDDLLDGADMSLESRHYATEYYTGMNSYSGVDYACLWSLEQYRSTVKKEERADDWDELERSVIASVADDVIVGVRGRHADLVIVKKFA